VTLREPGTAGIPTPGNGQGPVGGEDPDVDSDVDTDVDTDVGTDAVRGAVIAANGSPIGRVGAATGSATPRPGSMGSTVAGPGSTRTGIRPALTSLPSRAIEPAAARTACSHRATQPRQLHRGSCPFVTVRDMDPKISPMELRQGVLSVSVWGGVDLHPEDGGVRVADRSGVRGRPGRLLTWAELSAVCGHSSPQSPAGRRRLGILLRLEARLAGLTDPGAWLRDHAVLLALPPDHVDHLGPRWTHRRLGGDALWLGLGIHLADEETAVPVPPGVLDAHDVAWQDCWPTAAAWVEQRAAVAAELVAGSRRDAGALRSVGGCDVLSLLIGAPLRETLARADGTGMRAVALPDRRRGWFDLTRVDPAYVALAWQLTDAPFRGLPRPVLVTRDVVALPAVGGDLGRHAVELR